MFLSDVTFAVSGLYDVISGVRWKVSAHDDVQNY
jgi:hypothetical protein